MQTWDMTFNWFNWYCEPRLLVNPSLAMLVIVQTVDFSEGDGKNVYIVVARLQAGDIAVTVA